MGNVETADTLSFIGAILSVVFGTIWMIWGIVQVIWARLAYWPFWSGAGIGWIISGIIAMIFGVLTLMVARKSFLSGDLRTGAIMFFIFGGLSAHAIGGILTIVAGILSIIAYSEQMRGTEPPPPQPAPAPEAGAPAGNFCQHCGARISTDAAFCPSCGKKIER